MCLNIKRKRLRRTSVDRPQGLTRPSTRTLVLLPGDGLKVSQAQRDDKGLCSQVNLKGDDRSWRARVRSIAIESHQELLLRVPLQQTPSRVSLCCFSFSFSSFLALLATDRPCLSLLSRSPIYFLESDLIFFLGPMRVHVLTRNYLQKILGRAMNY